MVPYNYYPRPRGSIPFVNKILLFINLLCLLTSAMALPNDKEQAIHIQANTSTFNYKTGISLYEGNVHIKQGTTQLIADRITTQSNPAHQLKEANAYGLHQLAEYTTLPKQGSPLVHAKARVIRFYPLKSLIVLTGEVLI